jgi:hypothetical protein
MQADVEPTYPRIDRTDSVSWMSLLRTARVSYGLFVLVAAGLLLPDQMQDMLAAARDDTFASAAFPLSLGFFALSCWYWARATISARFDLPDTMKAWHQVTTKGERLGRPLLLRLPLYTVPQAPIPLAGVVGLVLAIRSQAIAAGLLALGCLALLWLFINQRRNIRDRLRALVGRTDLVDALSDADQRLRTSVSIPVWWSRVGFRLKKLLQRAPFGPGLATVWLGVSVLIFLISSVASFWPATAHEDYRDLIWTIFKGPTPVLVGAALIIGPLSAATFIADGWRPTLTIGDAPIGLKRPPVMAFLIAVTGIVPLIATLHSVRIIEIDHIPAGVLKVDRRPTLGTKWAEWQARCGSDTRPVLIAISGGASRAGLWGAAVVNQVETRIAGRKAAIFAISSVSGGSLGAAAYMAARASERSPDPGLAGCQMSESTKSKFGGFASKLGSADEVGPLLSGYMFSDLPRSLIGWVPKMFGATLRGGDRAEAIERAFEHNAKIAALSEKLEIKPFDSPFLGLAAPNLPLWIANGTERDSGSRALTVALQPATDDTGKPTNEWPFLGASDVLGQLQADVPISTAINNTARFPFLEPAGRLVPASSGHPGVGILDGGYFDNSGLQSVLEVASWLEQQNVHPIIVVATGDGDGNGVRRSSNAGEPNERPEISKVHPEDIVRCSANRYNPSIAHTGHDVAEILSPLIGLYSVRAGHVDIQLRRAAARYCDAGSQAFFHFYLPACHKESVPLNWVLSPKMTRHVWISAANPPVMPSAGDKQGSESADGCVPPNYSDAFIETNRAEGGALEMSLTVDKK